LYFKYIKRIKIGKGCCISILADISGNVVIGKHVTIERGAVIKGNVKIGDHTMIGAYASITTTPTGYIEIGNFCHINNFNIIGSCKRVIIKDYALFAVGVKITDSSRDYSSLKLPTKKAPIISEDIVIEENVWCGFDVCIIMGGGIGKNCIIGAKSLVNKKIPDNSIAFGIPARVYKKRNGDE
jgi:acetyltransferase-like isoleucine patch superfamily enzyme